MLKNSRLMLLSLLGFVAKQQHFANHCNNQQLRYYSKVCNGLCNNQVGKHAIIIYWTSEYQNKERRKRIPFPCSGVGIQVYIQSVGIVTSVHKSALIVANFAVFHFDQHQQWFVQVYWDSASEPSSTLSPSVTEATGWMPTCNADPRNCSVHKCSTMVCSNNAWQHWVVGKVDPQR